MIVKNLAEYGSPEGLKTADLMINSYTRTINYNQPPTIKTNKSKVYIKILV